MNPDFKSFSFGRVRLLAVLTAGLTWTGLTSVQAAVTVTADPAYPASAALITLDPEVYAPASRGVTDTRLLRQTFQLSQSVDVDGIVLSLAATGTDGGLILRVYEVADVNASTWSPGTLVKTLTLATSVNLPGTAQRLGLKLSGADIFTLPQRNSGAGGYGIEIANVDGTSNVGSLRHSNDGVDNYGAGKFYTESGLQSGAGERDVGLALSGAATPPPASGPWYVAPTGNDANSGSIGSPFETITKAQSVAVAGDVVYLRGGTYSLDNSDITQFINPRDIVNYITKDGISYLAYSNEVPVFDFSAVRPVGHRVVAFYVTADNCVFEGFEVVGVQVTIAGTHTQSECFHIRDGNNNRFERLSMHDGMGIGWYLTRGGGNVVINCDAYNNKGLDGFSHGNIDGFGAHTDRTSDTGNQFIGCRAWFNSDDGFDLINCDAPVVISNCWAMNNGYDYESPGSKIGDSTGFKAGGYGISGAFYPIPVPRHQVFNCFSLGSSRGFYANHHTGGLDFVNNTGIANGNNYNLLCNTNASAGGDVPGFDHYLKNNLGFDSIGGEVVNLAATGNDDSDNYWTLPVTVTGGDFESLDVALLTQPRQANGDLPVVAYARLKSGSDLIDAGLDVGLPFNAVAPDLGAFEFGPIHHPVIDSVAAHVGQSSEVIFSGLHGQAYELRASADPALGPVTAWAPVDNGVFGPGPESVIDLTSAGVSQRFYIIRVP